MTRQIATLDGTGVLASAQRPAHTHAESDVTSLTSDLAGKATTGHVHTGAGLTKLSALAIAVIQTAYAHGLGGTPSVVIISPRGASFVFESANADATNVYLTGAGVTTADVYVAL
jgi:hypothetical protein